MADTVRLHRRPTTLDEFLEWEEAQADKHEFRNGQIRMMTGGTQRHNLIATNVLVALRAKLGKGPCRPYAMNARVALKETEAGYYPDVVIDCGPYRANALAATKPTVVFEVLSASTRATDFSEKVPDYRDTESIVQIVLVEPDERRLHVRLKPSDTWRQFEFDGGKGRLDLPSVGTFLMFDEIYEDT